MKQSCLILTSNAPEQTMAIGARFARLCLPDDVVGLQGTLGAGKTCFVKGMARGLGVADERAVTSPTFVLMKSHEGSLALHHFDAYRLSCSDELEAIGCQETFESGSVSVVEWADHVRGCLPQEHFFVTITVTGDRSRELRFRACGEATAARLGQLSAALAQWREV